MEALTLVVALMDKNRFTRVSIVDQNDRLCGIVAREDILRAIATSVAC